MNTSSPPCNGEVPWKTYLKTAAFLAPAISILCFSCVFLIPKLETLWRDAGFTSPSALTFLHLAQFSVQHWLPISTIVIVVLAFLEWRSAGWPRYRRAMAGASVFVVNTVILVFMTMMFATALLVAPRLNCR